MSDLCEVFWTRGFFYPTNVSLTFAQLKMIEGEERSSAAGKEDDVSPFMLFLS